MKRIEIRLAGGGRVTKGTVEGLPQGVKDSSRWCVFHSAAEYFTAIADAAICKLDLSASKCGGPTPFATLSHFVFRGIVHKTTLFKDGETKAQFPLNHMDLGTHNILINENFNFLAIIDWEFTQTAPWQVNHYPMPFPLQGSDTEIESILRNPNRLAYKATLRQESARRMYNRKLRGAEVEVHGKGRPVGASFAEVLDSPSSRIYGCFTRGGDLPEGDALLVYEMVRLAFGLDAAGTERYLQEIEVEVTRVRRLKGE